MPGVNDLASSTLHAVILFIYIYIYFLLIVAVHRKAAFLPSL